MSVSVVCAYDINDTNDQSHDGLKSSSIDSISSNVKSDDSLKVNNTDLLKSSDNDKLSADTSGLQTLIDGQSAGTTLTLTKDYTITGTVTINKKLTIDGRGLYTINGNNLYRIFEISGNDVVLKNIIFKNAKTNLNNGAAGIYWTGTGASLIGCTFENCINSAGDGKGGAVYFDQQATVTDSTFKNCKANAGGAIYFNAKNNTVTNSIFMSNSASYSAVAYNRWIDSNIFVNCVYLGNTATVSGNEFSRSALTNKNATYTLTDLANVITGKSSVVLNANYRYYQTTDYEKYYNGLKINEAITINGNGYTLDGNGKVKLIFLNCSNVVIRNTNFINARSITGAAPEGSSVDAGGAMAVKYSGHSIINCTFTNCTDDVSASGGGAIRVALQSHNILIDSCKFYNNRAKHGGAVYVNQGDYDVIIRNCEFTGNKAQSAAGSGYGGALLFNTLVENVLVDNCTFKNNQAIYGGVGFSYVGINITNVKYTGNTATQYGNNFALTFNALQQNVNKLTQGSTFDLYGDVIRLSTDSGLSDTGVVINTKGIKIKGNGHTMDATSGSRMFKVQSDDVIVENISFVNGKITSVNDGGAFYWMGKNGKINSCNFTNNQASIGGAVYILPNASGTTISDCNFTNNKATSGTGGAIWASMNLVVSNSYFSKNSANTYGGAIYQKEAALTINNSTFIENRATTQGGGVYSATTGYTKTLNNTIFLGNDANSDKHYYLGGTVRKINITLTYSDLRNLVKTAQNNGQTTLNLDANYKYYYTDGNKNPDGSYSAIEIKSGSSIKTINGNGYTLDSAGSDLHTIIIWKNNPNFKISNLNIINAFRKYHASVLYTEGVNGVFENINVENCSVSIPGRKEGVSGGCVYVTEDATGNTFRNVNFTDCTLTLYSDENNGAFAGGAAMRLGSSSNKLINCIFTNCHSGWDGGAVLVGNAWLSTTPPQRENNILTNCQFVNCSSKYGPAVYFYNNANARLEGCTFKYNHGVGHGGSVWFGSYCKIFTIEGCTFIGNDASIGDGGALYIGSNLDTVNINKCNFINNNATKGGAIVILAGAKNIIVSNCNFTNNTAKYGGAGYANTATITLTNLKYNENKASIVGNNFLLPLTALKNTIDGLSPGATYTLITDFMYLYETDKDLSKGGIAISKKLTLNGNGLSIDAMNAMRIFSITAADVTFNNITFKGGNAASSGALSISTDANNLKLNGCTFIGNKANSTSGGVIGITSNGVKINNCKFINNSATTWGGAIQLGSSKTGFEIRNSEFINNTAVHGGSACNLDSVAIITSSKFINNTITTTSTAIDYAGAVRLSYSHTNTNTLADLTFIGNKAINSGTAGLLLLSPATASGFFIFENNHGFYGGALLVSRANGFSIVGNFSNNKANQGGAIYINSTNVNIKGNFTNNSATADGGAIYINSDNTQIEGNFFNNSASGSGGAVSVVYLATSGATVRNSHFENNTGRHGGALSFQSKANKIYNSVFVNNHALASSGAVEFSAWSSGYSINNYLISGCKFINNSAADTAGAVRIYNSANTADRGQLINNEFINNSAQNGGALILDADSAVVTNCNFINNTASNDGGAVHILRSNIDVKYSNFTNNVAKGTNTTVGGGAISCKGANAEIIDCNFKSNAAVRGGAIYIDAQNAYVYKSNFIKNNATIHGGAIYVYSGGAGSKIVNSTFRNNSAINRGGAIWVFANSDILNCTIENNVAGQAAVFVHVNTALNIKGSTLLNNKDLHNGYWNVQRQDATGTINIESSILDAIVNITGNTLVYGNMITGTGVFNDGTVLAGVTGINLTANGILLTNSLNINDDKSFVYSISKSLAAGNYTLTVGNVDSKKNKYIFTVVGNFTVLQANSTISTSPINSTYEDENIQITVESQNATAIHYIITDSNGVVKYEGNTTVINGIFNVLNTLNLDVGEYTVNLSTIVDGNHSSVYNTTKLTVKPFLVDLNISSTVEVYPNKITLTLTANRNGNYTVNVEGKNYLVEVKNGIGTQILDVLSGGNHTVNVTSNMTNYYVSKLANVTVIKSNSTISLDIDPILQKFTVTVTPGATGNVTIKINETIVVVNLDLSKGNTIVIGGLSRNVYNATATYNGDENYNSSVCSKIFKVTKSISSINVTLDNNVITYGDSVKVTVSVYTVESNPNPINGTVNVTIGGKTQTINLNDNENSTIFTGLAGGEYNVEVVYFGNDAYTAATNNTQKLVVNPANPTLVITPASIVYGQDLTVNISLTGVDANVSGNVIVSLNGIVYNITLKDGNASVKYSNVPAGENTVYVNYTGDCNYSSITNAYKTFTVTKAQSKVNATSTTTISYGDNLTVNVDSINATGISYQIIDSTGNVVKQSIIGKDENIFIENLKLDVGTYTLNLTTIVNANYTSTSNHTSKIVINNATIKSLYVVCDPVDYLVNPIVYVYSAVDGNYTVTVNHKNYDVTVVSGVGNVTIDVLDVNNYTVEVSSNVKNYNPLSNNTNLTVKKINSSIILTVDASIQNFTVVASPNATGIVTVIVKGTSLRGVINLTKGENSVQIPGFEDGGYDAYAIYSGDNNYYNSTSSEIEFIVNKLHVGLNVTFNTTTLFIGDNVKVFINISSDATGNVTFKLANQTKTFDLATSGNRISFDINKLSGGRHYWEVYYGGDYRYGSLNMTGNNRYIDVNKINSVIVIDTPAIAIYGNDIIVNVTLTPDKARGNVTVRFGSQIQTFTFKDSNSHNFTFKTEPIGNYRIIVDYAGNENYTFASQNKAIDIITANITLNITNSLTYPEKILIINASADGNYTVRINSEEYNITVVNGTCNLTLTSHLPVNTYTIDITANIANYNPFAKTYSLSVNNGTIEVNATVINATYPNKGQIFVNATLDGNYTVIVGGENYVVTVVNGTGNITFNQIAANNYTVNIIRNIANYNPVSVIRNLTISKNTPKINVTVIDVIYPGIVSVNITSDVNGTYVLSIGGKVNETDLTAGVSKVVTIAGLAANEVGYSVNVTYAETENYTAAFNDTGIVKVFKANSTVNATSVVVVYGDSIVVNVTAFNASSVVWEVLKGSVRVANGTAVVNNNVTDFTVDLPAGNYTIVLTTVVDANHTVAVNSSATLNITKYTPKINVTVIDVIYPNVVTVNVTSDVDGTYVLNIGGKTNSTELVAGVSKIVTISGLAANEVGYSVNVTYAETENYTAAFNDTGIVKVFKANSTVNATSVVVVYGDSIVVNVTAFNASSVVWEVLKGSVKVANGTAVVINNVTDFAVDLAVGNYTIVLTTVVDANHTVAVNSSATLNITKYTPKINVVVVDVIYPNAIRVNVTGDVSGTYTIDINGVLNVTELTKGVSKIIEFKNFKANETGYNINVTYSETENYTAAFNDTKFVKVFKASSSVNASNVVVIYGNPIIIQVTAINASDVIWAIMDGTTQVANGTAVVSNNITTIDGLDLAVGNYTIVLTTVVDENHTVAVNNSATLNVTKYSPKINVYVVDIVYPGIVSVEITSDVDGTYVLNIGGKTNSTELVAGVSKIVTISNLAANEIGYIVNVTYAETENYTAVFNDTEIVKVFKANSTVNATSVVVVYRDSIIINITATNASDINWIIMDGNVKVSEGISPVIGNNANITGLDLAVGNYNIILTTIVDGNHSSSINNSTTLNITKYTPKIHVNVENVEYPNTVYVTVVSDVDGVYTVKIGDKSQSDEIFAGIPKIIPIMGLNANEFGYVVNVTYAETQNYTSAFNDTSIVKILKAPSSVNATSMVVVYGDEFIINITAVNATGIVWEIINGTTKVRDGVSQVIDGKANISDIKLPAGNYTVVLTTQVDSNHNYVIDSQTTLNITRKVPIIEPTINTPQMVYGMNLNITVTLPGDATGLINITAGNKSYVKQLKNGTVDFNIPGLEPGLHNLTIAYLGDNNYQNSTTSILVKVSNKLSYTHVSVEDIFRGENVTITVTVPDDATGNVTIEVANITYNVTISNGNATLIIANLTPEIYSINATYLGDEYYTDSFNDTVSFKVKTDKTVIADEMIRGYNSGIDYQVKFTDDIDKPLANTEVILTVDGKPYHLITDENGVARLNITVPVGNHTIVAVNPVTGEEAYSSFIIVKRLVGDESMVMDFKDGSYYVVRVIGEDGKPVGEGVTVAITVNGITYRPKTDSEGYARLAINLNPNTFKVTSNYAGDNITTKLVVKQTLSANKIQNVKKSAKTIKVKATLKWSSGKAIVGKTVSMKFRGKLYYAKTNSKGVAIFKLPKKAVKKLKVGKKYKVRYTYLTNSIYKYLKIVK